MLQPWHNDDVDDNGDDDNYDDDECDTNHDDEYDEDCCFPIWLAAVAAWNARALPPFPPLPGSRKCQAMMRSSMTVLLMVDANLIRELPIWALYYIVPFYIS